MDESSLDASVSDSYRQRFNRWFQPRWLCVPWWSFESRSSVQSSLLRLLAMAHAHRLAISPLVRNFAYEHRGLRKLRMLRLARRLESGTPLVEALEQTPDVLSEQDVLTLRFASQTGTLGSAYEHLSRTGSVAHQERATLFRQFIFDTAAMLLSSLIVVLYYAIFVMPKLLGMVDELAMRSAWITRSHKAVWDQLLQLGGFWIVIGLGIALVLFSSLVRRTLRHKLAAWATRLGAKSRSAELLRLLSLTVESGRPMTGALSTLARYHFDKDYRQKLLFIRNEVEHGADVWQCFADAKVLTSSESSALRQSPTAQSQAWALWQFAEMKEAATQNRIDQALVFARPIVVLLQAAFVLWIAMGVFQIMTQLTIGLSR